MEMLAGTAASGRRLHLNSDAVDRLSGSVENPSKWLRCHVDDQTPLAIPILNRSHDISVRRKLSTIWSNIWTGPYIDFTDRLYHRWAALCDTCNRPRPGPYLLQQNGNPFTRKSSKLASAVSTFLRSVTSPSAIRAEPQSMIRTHRRFRRYGRRKRCSMTAALPA